MKTACLGKIRFSSYSQKWLSANEISGLFNRQYFTNRLMSDFDFSLINRFSEKNSHLGKRAILGPKIMYPHNSGSTGRIFFKFCAMKGADR